VKAAAFFYSRGIPRVMNLFANARLINAYVDISIRSRRRWSKNRAGLPEDEFHPFTSLTGAIASPGRQTQLRDHRNPPALRSILSGGRNDFTGGFEVHTFASPLAFAEEKSAADVAPSSP